MYIGKKDFEHNLWENGITAVKMSLMFEFNATDQTRRIREAFDAIDNY